MKKFLAFLLVLIALLSLAGCQKGGEEKPTPDDTTVQDSQDTQDTEKDEPADNSSAADDKPADTEEDKTDVTEEEDDKAQQEQETEQDDEQNNAQNDEQSSEQETALSYTEKIVRPDQSIFDGPSYDHSYVGVVGQAGVYTIVEEATDDEGNLWGKLKSGVGWVDLTDIRSFNWPISANFADKALLESGNYHYWADENSDYVVEVAFRAYEELSFVTIYPLILTDDGMVAGEAVLYLEKLTPDKPLVAELSFPGDMSEYAIQFTTEKGADTYFRVYISGRNGTLVLDE